MPRFFTDAAQISETHILLDDETQKHIQVLRLAPNENFTICDGAGRDYLCILDGAAARILSHAPNLAEPKLQVSVFLAFSRGERMDLAIQKSVELGAASISLFPSRYCVAKYSAKDLPKKCARWEKIILEAAKQSGRGRLPALHTHSSFQSAMEAAACFSSALFFYEQETASLKARLADSDASSSLSFVIGSEGGFSVEEATLAASLGLLPTSLGPRILRCETAPLAALSAILFHAGEL